MRGLVAAVVVVSAACAPIPHPIVPVDLLERLQTCQALVQERDRAWDAAWTWEEQIAAQTAFLRAAEAAGCMTLGDGWEI